LGLEQRYTNNGGCPECGYAMWRREEPILRQEEHIKCMSNDCGFLARVLGDDLGECHERN
jgi:hypothetical protein